MLEQFFSIHGPPPINLYLVPRMPDTGLPAFRSTPGLPVYVDTGLGAEIRGLWSVNQYMYGVGGDTFFRLHDNGDGTAGYTAKGTIDTNAGPVQIMDNGAEVMVVDGVEGYIYNIASEVDIAAITDDDFPVPSFGTYQDTFFVVTKYNTKEFYISNAADGLNWTATDFGQCIVTPRVLLAVISDHRELWLFKEDSYEVFYNRGDADFPFKRRATNDHTGIGAVGGLVKHDQTILWPNIDGVIHRAVGHSSQVVSSDAYNDEVSRYSKISDATAFGFYWAGHPFYQINFPSENKSWRIDLRTDLTFRVESYPDFGRHRANCYNFFTQYRRHIVGDYANGKIYRMDDSVYYDNSELIRRRRTTPPVFTKSVDTLKLGLDAGVGLITGEYTDPQVMMRMSDDRMKTWTPERRADLGPMGKYNWEIYWDQLGEVDDSMNGRQFEFTVTDPVSVTFRMVNMRGEPWQP